MTDRQAIADLNDRIAILRANIAELVEQAAGHSGAADESLAADRIAAIESALAEAIKKRDAAEASAKGQLSA